MCMCVTVHVVFGVSFTVGCVVHPFSGGGDFWIVVVKAIIVVCADPFSLCPAR